MAIYHTTLSDEDLVLRGPRHDDIADRLRCGNRPEFVQGVGGDARSIQPMMLAEAEAWIGRVADDPQCWVIDVDGQAVGTARLHHIDAEKRSAMFAIGIFDSDQWGKGYGTAATRLVVAHGFDRLGLHRIALRVLIDNERAIRVYERCGFVREGLHRDVEFVGGRWLSDLWMSILEDEYRARLPSMTDGDEQSLGS